MRQRPPALTLAILAIQLASGMEKLRLIGVTICLASFLTAGAAEAEQLQAVQLKQAHYFLGDATLTAAKDAVRIENTGRLKYTIVARAPEWRVNIFRKDDRTYFSESLNQFADTGLVSDFLVSRRSRYMDHREFSKTSVSVTGHTVTCLTAGQRVFKFLALAKGTAPQVDLVIHSAYKLPTCGGLPVEFIGQSDRTDWVSGAKKGVRQVWLSTQAIDSVNVSSEIFDLPKNYTKAKSVREVVAGNDTREESYDVQDLFESGHGKKNK